MSALTFEPEMDLGGKHREFVEGTVESIVNVDRSPAVVLDVGDRKRCFFLHYKVVAPMMTRAVGDKVVVHVATFDFDGNYDDGGGEDVTTHPEVIDFWRSGAFFDDNKSEVTRVLEPVWASMRETEVEGGPPVADSSWVEKVSDLLAQLSPEAREDAAWAWVWLRLRTEAFRHGASAWFYYAQSV